MAVNRNAAIGVLDIPGGKIERVDIGDAPGAVDERSASAERSAPSWLKTIRKRPLAGSMRFTLILVLTLMPMRSLSAWSRATASASIAGNSFSRASRIVTSVPVRA